MNLSMNPGVAELLANAHSTPSDRGKKFYFQGDLCQMAKASSVASQLGISTGINGGIPYVSSQKDFDTVKQYLINNRIEGWWNYVSNDEYRRLKASSK